MAFELARLPEAAQDVGSDAPGSSPAAEEGSEAPKTYGARQRTRAQIGKGSSAKGAAGEREVLTAFRSVMMNVEEQLKDEGLTFVARSDFATRKRIEKGTSNRDLGNIPLISIEVKRNENLNVAKAWEQAVRQADKLLPVLVYRYNREPWRVRTTAALINPNGSPALYVVGEVSLPDFLTYFSALYSGYLKGVIRE